MWFVLIVGIGLFAFLGPRKVGKIAAAGFDSLKDFTREVRAILA